MFAVQAGAVAGLDVPERFAPRRTRADDEPAHGDAAVPGTDREHRPVRAHDGLEPRVVGTGFFTGGIYDEIRFTPLRVKRGHLQIERRGRRFFRSRRGRPDGKKQGKQEQQGV